MTSEKEKLLAEKESLQNLIMREKEKKEALQKKKTERKKASAPKEVEPDLELELESEEEVVEKVEAPKKAEENMAPWVEGVFINRENEGGILSFSYNSDRFAIKDGETCEIPLYIADHLNSLKYTEYEWVRSGADDHEGKSGEKSVKTVKTRCEFRVLRRFDRPKSYKIKRPERHRM